MARKTRDTARAMGGSWYSRAMIAQREDVTERRKVQYARRLYQEHQVYSMAVLPASVSATVQGSQLDPFAVSLARVPGDPAVVLSLLAAQGASGELLAVTRGQLGRNLGSLVLPESASDVVVECACPDHSGACVHALALTYEFCSAADGDPSLVLDFAGVSLAGLLARLTSDDVERPRSPGQSVTGTAGGEAAISAAEGGHRPWGAGAAAFYGDGAELPPLPEPVPMDLLQQLDPALLRTALRRTGTRPAEVVQAQDELAELYDRLREPR